MQRHRGFIATWNQPKECDGDDDEIQAWRDIIQDMVFTSPLPAGVVYTCGQLEKGDATERPHFQVFVYYKNKKTDVGAANAWEEHGHFTPVKGANGIKHSCVYCTKLEGRIEGPWECGERPRKGKRSDLEEIGRLLVRGYGERDVALSFPGKYVQYHRGFRALAQLIKKPTIQERELIILWGPTGTGKSHRAWNKWPDAYPIERWEWWDGYEGEETVIFDEFPSISVSITSFLRVVDKWPMRLPVKGSYVPRVFKRIVLTSNMNPEDWGWKEGATAAQQDAFKRRITKSIHIEDRENEYNF